MKKYLFGLILIINLIASQDTSENVSVNQLITKKQMVGFGSDEEFPDLLYILASAIELNAFDGLMFENDLQTDMRNIVRLLGFSYAMNIIVSYFYSVPIQDSFLPALTMPLLLRASGESKFYSFLLGLSFIPLCGGHKNKINYRYSRQIKQ